ncbi:MAG TPA: YpdA family putative bacillithiol disulfide reductase [Bacillota bacterium]|nr:YpdA family putative bacillithiol disulfide reductase [Bacillota bacterium]
MQKEKVIIVGGGPCGLACSLALQKHGMDSLVIEKGNIVQTIYNFPTHQRFFSSSERLEIGGIPFITEKQKPVRNEALAYYRSVAARNHLRIHTFEKVIHVMKDRDIFYLETETHKQEVRKYEADYVIIATGYYDQPNRLGIPGEELAKVSHYFKEAHPYFHKDVVIIGGRNSAVDAALELHKAGANITVLYRGNTYSNSIKPWILPEFDSLVKIGDIHLEFNAHVTKITNRHVEYTVQGVSKTIKNDFVLAMTGYRPNTEFLQRAGIQVNRNNGEPIYNEKTYETNIPGLYVAGVVLSGYNNNATFIENGRFHGEAIAQSIMQKH